MCPSVQRGEQIHSSTCEATNACIIATFKDKSDWPQNYYEWSSQDIHSKKVSSTVWGVNGVGNTV